MEWIQRLLESGTTPIVTAFLLGLLTAISPCPLATNIAAVGFIGKDIDDKHRVFCNGLLYTAGRILTYAGIGLAFIPLLREGANTYALQKIIGKYGDAIVAPALILIKSLLFILLIYCITYCNPFSNEVMLTRSAMMLFSSEIATRSCCMVSRLRSVTQLSSKV